MSAGVSADPALDRMADAILIPPFPGETAPRWVLYALERGLAGVTIFGPNIAGPEQLAGLTAQLRSAGGLPLVAIDEEGGRRHPDRPPDRQPLPGQRRAGRGGRREPDRRRCTGRWARTWPPWASTLTSPRRWT